MPKKYPDEFKVKAIRRYEKGESIQSLCQELHISQSTLYHWRREYCSIQTATHTYTPKEFDSITRRLQKAEHKLEIIQLSGYLSKVPLQDRIATLEHLHTEFTKVYSVIEVDSIFLMHFPNYCNSLVSNNPFPQLPVLMTTLWRKLSLRPSKRKKPTAENIHLNGISGKA